MRKKLSWLIVLLLLCIAIPGSGWSAVSAKLVSISVTPSNPTLEMGATLQFKATGTYSDGTTKDLTASATWTSSATNAATISNTRGSKGLVTAVYTGPSTISATASKITGTTTLTVVPVLTSITIAPQGLVVYAGTPVQFTATGTYSDGSTRDITTSVIWVCDDPGLIISNEPGSNGLANTDNADGLYPIGAVLGGVIGNETIIVYPRLLSISVIPKDQTATEGDTVPYFARFTWSNGSTGFISPLVWSSSDTTVATISSSTRRASALSAGSTTITATYTAPYGLISGSTTLTVAAAPVLSSVNLPKTGQTTSYAAGDDGALQKGASWPVPRFESYSTATRTDRVTGLAWAPDGSTPTVEICTGGIKTWQAALEYVECLNTVYYRGHNDWRLPNRKELRSLVNYEQANPASWLNTQGFSNVQSNFTGNYWSSSTAAFSPGSAWCVQMQNGELNDIYCSKTNGYGHVLPVRSGEITAAAGLPVTGQATSYAAGDDGDLQKGVSWPAVRFSANADTTVTDNLTGLIWTSDANIPGPPQCLPVFPKTWYEAINYVACLNTSSYLAHADWRLPNVNELESLINAGQTDSAAWLNTQGFTNVQSYDYYWTSTSYAPETIDPSAIGVSLRDGDISHGKKDCGCSYFYVWPVRGGN